MRFLDLLPIEPAELVRKDKYFKELGLNADDYVTREAVVDVLLEHPKLMQRPVVIRGDRAILARFLGCKRPCWNSGNRKWLAVPTDSHSGCHL